ncbi:hypothetical protein Syun_031339 [Stephania yunnanensis]|uniref:Uncharacterized protein n=1 Tax=Stephania yunnanensis TaxID=152371 RepID=A0AAP0DYD6_9MAGN
MAFHRHVGITSTLIHRHVTFNDHLAEDGLNDNNKDDILHILLFFKIIGEVVK